MKRISYSSCSCPPSSTAQHLHVSPPGAGKQHQTFVTFQSAVASCLQKHPLPRLLLRSHCTAGEVAWGFIFENPAKLCKRSEGSIHHPGLVCGTSNALTVPSEAGARRIYTETATTGHVASANPERGPQVLGNTKAAAQQSDEPSVFSQARCPKSCTLILTCFSSARNL